MQYKGIDVIFTLMWMSATFTTSYVLWITLVKEKALDEWYHRMTIATGCGCVVALAMLLIWQPPYTLFYMPATLGIALAGTWAAYAVYRSPASASDDLTRQFILLLLIVVTFVLTTIQVITTRQFSF